MALTDSRPVRPTMFPYTIRDLMTVGLRSLAVPAFHSASQLPGFHVALPQTEFPQPAARSDPALVSRLFLIVAMIVTMVVVDERLVPMLVDTEPHSAQSTCQWMPAGSRASRSLVRWTSPRRGPALTLPFLFVRPPGLRQAEGSSRPRPCCAGESQPSPAFRRRRRRTAASSPLDVAVAERGQTGRAMADDHHRWCRCLGGCPRPCSRFTLHIGRRRVTSSSLRLLLPPRFRARTPQSRPDAAVPHLFVPVPQAERPASRVGEAYRAMLLARNTRPPPAARTSPRRILLRGPTEHD